MGLTNATELTLWASNVTDAAAATGSVWCLVTPEGYEGDPPRVNLEWNPARAQYEAPYAGFTATGVYALTFCAANEQGEKAEAVPSAVYRVTAPIPPGPDAYESDNKASAARAIKLDVPQVHTFHATNDEDWVYLLAVSNLIYDIETIHLSTNVDSVLEIYNSSLQKIDTVDLFGPEDGELAGLDFPKSGFYYVRVSQDTTQGWEGGAYALLISARTAGEYDFLCVAGGDQLSGGPLPAGCRVEVRDSGGNLQAVETFDGESAMLLIFGLPENQDYTVELVDLPEGYRHVDPEAFPAVQSAHVPYQDGAPVCFVVMPYVQVRGALREQVTALGLADAWLLFRAAAARGVIEVGDIYRNYPNTGGGSKTGPGGEFPENVFLPVLDWDLLIERPGCETVELVGAVREAYPGMAPLDVGAVAFPAFRITNVAAAAGGPTIGWVATPGREYALERSTNLLGGYTSVWSGVAAGTAAAFQDTSATGVQQIYY